MREHSRRTARAAPKLLPILLLAAVWLSACTPASTATPTAAPTAVLTVSPLPATPTAGATGVPTVAALPEGSFVNPVLDRDFPDPDVLNVGGTYYAYATNSEDVNIQVARATDLVHWNLLSDALPMLPTWAVQEFGWAWAPEVTTSADGQTYLMYFTARYTGTQCIGVATSAKPEGPFASTQAAPFICQTGEGGSIDPTAFVDDDGTRYLLWKNDGNSTGGQTFIYIQPVSADGLTLEGEPVRLIRADQRWEGILVEAPTLWKRAGLYYLLYSANDYSSPRYAVGYAVADSPLGPYEKAKAPLLATNLPAGIVGPGGQDVVAGPDGNTWLLFHGWRPAGYRGLNLAELDWENGQPTVADLSRDPLPAP